MFGRPVLSGVPSHRSCSSGKTSNRSYSPWDSSCYYNNLWVWSSRLWLDISRFSYSCRSPTKEIVHIANIAVFGNIGIVIICLNILVDSGSWDSYSCGIHCTKYSNIKGNGEEMLFKLVNNYYFINCSVWFQHMHSTIIEYECVRVYLTVK